MGGEGRKMEANKCIRWRMEVVRDVYERRKGKANN